MKYVLTGLLFIIAAIGWIILKEVSIELKVIVLIILVLLTYAKIMDINSYLWYTQGHETSRKPCATGEAPPPSHPVARSGHNF